MCALSSADMWAQNRSDFNKKEENTMNGRIRNILISVILLANIILTACNGSKPTASGSDNLIIGVPTLGVENFKLNQRVIMLTTLPYERLFRQNYTEDVKTGKEQWGPQLMLAQSYTESADGMTYDIYLRHGIQFQEGWGELTADDVIYSFDQVKDPANQSSGSWYFASVDQGGYIKSYEAVDKYHVRVQLAKPYPLFLLDLADTQLVIVCKKYVEKVGWEAAGKHPIGTSPWHWIETVPGQYIKFERVDNHWRKTPDFKFLTLQLAVDPASQMMMLKSGQVNMIGISADQVQDVEASGLKVISIPEMRNIGLVFGGQLLETEKTYDPTVPWAPHQNEPADSDWNLRALKVRQALSYAVDVDSIIKNIYQGYGTPAPNNYFVSDSGWVKSSWTPYPYDPAKAKQLLAEAGYPNGFAKPIQFLINSVDSDGYSESKVAEEVCLNLEAIGLKVNRVSMDPNDIYTVWKVNKDNAWKMMIENDPVPPEPTWGWPWTLSTYAVEFSIGEYRTFDDYINRALTTIDTEKRKQIVQDGGDWLYNNYVSRPIAIIDRLYAISPSVKDWPKTEFYTNGFDFTSDYEYIEKSK